MKFDRELLKGHLKILLLAVLEDEPCHAYGFNLRLQEKSMGVFELPEGTVYPSLHKLERDGLIKSARIEREKGPVIRNYELTAKGKKVLESGRREWNFFLRAMEMVLEEKRS
jgi:PadR family transcriptional regulator PadR